MDDEQMDEAQMRALSDEMLGVYNRHDIEAWVEHLTEDVLWTEPTLPEPAHGKQAVAAALRDTFTAFPDLQVRDLTAYPTSRARPRSSPGRCPARYRADGERHAHPIFGCHSSSI